MKADNESVTVIEISTRKPFVTALQEEVCGVKNRNLPDYTIVLDENAVLDKSMKSIDPAIIGKKPPAPPPALAA